MADRAVVNQAVQWAVETTPGTAVPASKTVRSVDVDIQIAGTNELYRPTGHKYPSLDIPNMEWTTWSVTGKPTYTEIIYLLAAHLGASTDTTVGTTGHKRVFTIADTATVSRKTLTIEKGSDVRAESITFALLHDLSFTFSRKNGISLTGAGIGQLFTDGVTMTATPSDVSLIPITGKQIDYFLDTTAANLGTTKLLRAFSVEFGITGVYGPIWPIDSANTSFADTVDLAPTTDVKITLEADAAGMAFLSQFRSGDTVYGRAAAGGPVFEAGTPAIAYSFEHDHALGIKAITNMGADDDGVSVVTIECEMVADTTLGYASQVVVINDTVDAAI